MYFVNARVLIKNFYFVYNYNADQCCKFSNAVIQFVSACMMFQIMISNCDKMCFVNVF